MNSVGYSDLSVELFYSDYLQLSWIQFNIAQLCCTALAKPYIIQKQSYITNTVISATPGSQLRQEM